MQLQKNRGPGTIRTSGDPMTAMDDDNGPQGMPYLVPAEYSDFWETISQRHDMNKRTDYTGDWVVWTGLERQDGRVGLAVRNVGCPVRRINPRVFDDSPWGQNAKSASCPSLCEAGRMQSVLFIGDSPNRPPPSSLVGGNRFPSRLLKGLRSCFCGMVGK